MPIQPQDALAVIAGTLGNTAEVLLIMLLRLMFSGSRVNLGATLRAENHP